MPVERVEKAEVLVVELVRGGEGTPEPRRFAYQYWSLDGRFLAEHDPHRDSPLGLRHEPAPASTQEAA